MQPKLTEVSVAPAGAGIDLLQRVGDEFKEA
jgi:hypothetical protein